MLKRENYNSEHIETLKKQTGADPSILERTVFAFGLLEALCRVKMPFIFKGETSLLILLDEPRRLSTDIDIIVAPGTDVDGFIQQAGQTDVDGFIQQAGQIFPFRDVKENIRKGNNGIEKRHFRFLFNSPRQGKEISILLDVVFEDNPYAKLITKPVQSRLLMSEGDSLLVTVPDKNCVLGDKLTAFAPHTTGIPFGIDKELEIIKQMFDCWTLLQEMDDYQTVAAVYNHVAQVEAGYRGLSIQPEDVLLDTIQSCLCIMGRNGIRPDDYRHYLTGINAIQGHIFRGRINGENAGMLACEIMYLAACLLTKADSFERVSDPEAYKDFAFTLKGMKRINYIRSVDPMAYAYLVKALQLLQPQGYFTDSIL